MPRAYGRDRVQALPDGGAAVLSREPKPWKPREKAPAYHHRADHPGTAVLWDDAHWEVLAVERRSEGFRYVLAPWDEQNVFRGMERYDEETERRRVEERRAELAASGQRTLLVLLAPLAGILPEDDQLALERRLGVPATRMTFLSALLLFLVGAYSVIMLIAAGLSGGAGAQLAPLLAGAYFFPESFARLIVVLSQGRPLGSLLAFPWLLVRLVRDERPPDLTHAPDARDRVWEQERSYRALLPVLALLPPDDQRLLQLRFGFDALSWGRTTARVLQVLGVLFAGSAVLNLLAGIGSAADLPWLVAGIAILVEQRGRMVSIRAGCPAGSFFGRPVRPFARALLVPDPAPAAQAAAGKG